MISPMTNPGTPVCFNADPLEIDPNVSIRLRRVYFVENIILDENDVVCANLQGVHDADGRGVRWAYDINYLDYVSLPESLTSLLTSTPLVTEREHEVAL